MDDLLGKFVELAVTVYGTYLLYRFTTWFLKRVGQTRSIGKFVSAEQGTGGEKFRLSLGSFFTWNVAVNADKGTVGGSIHVGTRKGWFVLSAIVALAASYAIPALASWLLPAALIAIAVSFLRRSVSEMR